jgi:hypothetical protein
MSIKGYVDELNMLNEEIKRNNMRNKKLRTRVKELESNIAAYLESKDQTGVKYNGQAIIVEHKPKHLVKKKKDKEEDVINLFKSLGIEDVDYAYQKLQEAQRGETVEHTKLKLSKLKNSQSRL